MWWKYIASIRSASISTIGPALADAIEIVCYILRVEVYLQAVEPLAIAIVTEDVILSRSRYFSSLVICTYGQALRLVVEGFRLFDGYGRIFRRSSVTE